MKKLSFLLLSLMFCSAMAVAVPAKPGVVKVQQPDGTTVSLRLMGDEYRHYNVTTDGLTIVKDQRGYYVYAALKGDELIPTAHVAHDPEARDAREQAYVATINSTIVPPMTALKQQQLSSERAAEARTRDRMRISNYDYTKMRGLIILVEFNDQEFSRPDYKDILSDMVNVEGYTGYVDEKGTKVQFTGSVRDYYNDNSGGLFKPEFDIAGPFKVNRSKYFPGEKQNGVAQLIRDALTAADDDVDFTKYDGDKNGEVDMVYFIFAGCGSNIGGNDARLLWPHASQVYNQYYSTYRKDGINFGRYACSTEMSGPERNPYIDGIGVICHEFTHVMGLPDFYDVDYNGSGGESDHPGDFDIMASGSYLNNSRTPSGYTLFERYIMRFTTPELIDGDGDFTLEKLNVCGTGYRINSPEKKEYFLLENRQREKWDSYIPAHGLLVYRVDSTNAMVWAQNGVNNDPNHMYFQLLRAGGSVSTTAFPGSANKTELTYASSPANLMTWDGKKTQMGLDCIAETSGVITFHAFNSYLLTGIDLPETFTVGVGIKRELAVALTPSTALNVLTWTTDNANVATVDASGMVTGVAEGTCRITVTSDNGLTATSVVTVETQNVADNIAAFKAMADNTEGVVKLNNAQVTYVNKGDVYLRDASGAIVLSGTDFNLKAGNFVNGTLYGRFVRADQMPYLKAVEGKTSENDIAVIEGSTPQPRRLKMSKISESDYADMVVIDAATLVKDGGIWAVSGDNRARLANVFGIKNIKVPSSINDKYFDVTAIYGTNVVNGQVINELKLLKSPVEVEAPSDAIVTVEANVTTADAPAFNLRGQRVDGGYRGIVVRGGKKYVVR